jgi:hypothetical protein
VAAAGLVVIALVGLPLWVVNGTGTSHVTTAPAPVGIAGASMRPADYDTIRASLEKVVGITAPIVTTNEQQRFLEQNTILPGAWTSAYMAAFTPAPGQDH